MAKAELKTQNLTVRELSSFEIHGGKKLKVMRWRFGDADLSARLLFCPGQGDYCARYREIFSRFAGEGLEIWTFDWPGHGESLGRRGHVGNAADAREILDSLIADMSRSGLLLGVGGHSMGGLLALDLLTRHADLNFAWVSSPLLKPTHGRSLYLRSVVQIFGRIFPSWTLDTGIQLEDCVGTNGARDISEIEKEFAAGLWHSRISLGWARALIQIAGAVELGRQQIFQKGRRIFVSQGGDDEICPAFIARSFFGDEHVEIKYLEIPQAKHEPFSEEPFAKCLLSALFGELSNWMAEIPENDA